LEGYVTVIMSLEFIGIISLFYFEESVFSIAASIQPISDGSKEVAFSLLLLEVYGGGMKSATALFTSLPVKILNILNFIRSIYFNLGHVRSCGYFVFWGKVFVVDGAVGFAVLKR